MGGGLGEAAGLRDDEMEAWLCIILDLDLDDWMTCKRRQWACPLLLL